jgi:phthiocerol/phenolphthiocerol synthesis type-I polyketide synthase E
MSEHEQELDNSLAIAVIGMSGRFPGAGDTNAFWENMKNGVEAIPFFSDAELSGWGVDADLLNNSGYVKTPGGGIEGADYFDADFFGYTPQEAQVMTPQTRVFHECCWEALEDAGYDPWSYDGEIGIFGGGRNSFDWQSLVVLSGKNVSLGEILSSTLYDKDNMTFRVSYHFNLRGPSFSLNTACSTGLVAVHLACQALLSGECDMALAGAAAITINRGQGHLYREGDILSPDGHLRAFDARARGLVYSDGAGAVVLKSLEEAKAHGDNIHALIKGSAINNDGHLKANYTAPSVRGQERVIRAALCMAGVEPASIGYIETHGTGTLVGDPIEIQALKQAFNSSQTHFCALGSIKTNVGHMTEAAGLGGLIKTILALKYRMIPPVLHFETPNPAIDLANSPFYINTRLKTWENGPYPRRAGVSSFARGGTNAHVVLEEAPRETKGLPTLPGEQPAREYQLILLSAKTPAALQQMSRNLADYLQKNAVASGNPAEPGLSLADAAYTLQIGRKALPYRRKLVCTAGAEAVDLLFSTDSRKNTAFACGEEEPPVVFMFPGIGSQYVDMGRDLYEKEVLFQKEMDRCFEILAPLTGDAIKRRLYPGEKAVKPFPIKEFAHFEAAQTSVFIFEYALAKLLMAWGITPWAMIGYSLGEYAAACLAGVFSLEDALKLVVRRGQLIRRLPAGVMLSIPLPAKEVKPLLPEGLSMAIDNGSSCIAAGPGAAIAILERRLKEKRFICTPVASPYALHSPQVDPILTDFQEAVHQVVLKEPRLPYISNVSGSWITAGEAIDPGYWPRHLRETVRFADGTAELMKKDKALFVEVGPGRDLSALVNRYTEEKAAPAPVHLVRPAHREADDLHYLLSKTGDLWRYGAKIDWRGFYQGQKRKRVSLPTYPFQRKRFVITVPPEWSKRLSMPQEISAEHSAAVNGGEEDLSRLELNDRPGLTNPFVPPRTPLENTLTGIWQELLGIQEIGREDDFLDLGGDSLKAVTVLSQVHKEYHVVMPLLEFFQSPTIASLAGYILKAESSAFLSVSPVEARMYYPLSSGQKRLYILQEADLQSVGYNLPQVYMIDAFLDIVKLKETFRKLIRRHESLRTCFPLVKGEVVQRVHQEVDFEIEALEAQPGALKQEAMGNGDHKEDFGDAIVNGFLRSFDLSFAPLLRVRLLKLGKDKHIFMVDMHHIVSDGVSNGVFIQDFFRFYGDEEPPALRLQYKDYSAWQNNPAVKKALKVQESYWLKELAGDLPVLELPLDYQRAAVRSFEGSRLYLEIPGPETDKMKQLAREEEVTIYMLILALFNVLLSKITGMEDIIIGIDTGGRSHADFEQIIGVFINTLVLRTQPERSKRFKTYLQEIKKKTLQAFDNQDWPFEELVEKMVKKRDMFRNPLFDVMFSYEHFEIKPLVIPEKASHLKLQPQGDGSRMSKLDMNVKAKVGDSIVLIFEYRTKLFAEKTIRRFTDYFKEITAALLEEENIKLGDFKVSHELLKVGTDLKQLDLDF